MKKLSILLNIGLIVFIAFQYFGKTESIEGIQFEDLTYEQALEKAKKENKGVFIDFYINNCGPCERLKREIFIRKQVGEIYNERFVNIKFNVENDPEIGKRFNITRYPTLMYIDNAGEIMHSFAGFKNKDEFIAEADKAKKYPYKIIKQWETEEHTLELSYKYLGVLKEMYKMPEYTALLLELTQKRENPYDQETFKLLEELIYQPTDTCFKFMVAHQDEFRKSVGHSVDSLINYHIVLNMRSEILNQDRLQRAYERLNEHKGPYADMLNEVLNAENVLYKGDISRYLKQVIAIGKKYQSKYPIVWYLAAEGHGMYQLFNNKLNSDQKQKIKFIADKAHDYKADFHTTTYKAFACYLLNDKEVYNNLIASLDYDDFRVKISIDEFLKYNNQQ